MAPSLDQAAIGQRIRLARKARGYDQASLAAIMKKPAPRLSEWETGKVQQSLDTLHRLSIALACPVGYFLGEVDPPWHTSSVVQEDGSPQSHSSGDVAHAPPASTSRSQQHPHSPRPLTLTQLREFVREFAKVADTALAAAEPQRPQRRQP